MSEEVECPERVMDPVLTEHMPPVARTVMRNALSAVVAVQTLTALHKLDGRQTAGSLVLLAVVIVATASVTSRRRADWIDHVALCLLVGAGLWLHLVTGHGQVYMCGYAAMFISMWWYGLPWGLVPTLLGVAAVGTSAAYTGHGSLGAGLGQAAGGIGLAAGAAFRRRGVLAARRNRILAAQLRDSREAEQRNALAAERARLARELHDVLAHTLSSLSLHLESTRVLAKSRKVDAEVMERLDRAVSLARTGLEEARSAVGTLRDDALPGPAQLPKLVADFGRDSEIAVQFAETGTPRGLEPEARVALFRAAQEALTNIGKHSTASKIDVSIEWLDDSVVLRVADNGHSASEAKSGGNGLRGMRERAELAGGTVNAGPGEAGYVVELMLPVPAAEPAQTAPAGVTA